MARSKKKEPSEEQLDLPLEGNTSSEVANEDYSEYFRWLDTVRRTGAFNWSATDMTKGMPKLLRDRFSELSENESVVVHAEWLEEVGY